MNLSELWEHQVPILSTAIKGITAACALVGVSVIAVYLILKLTGRLKVQKKEKQGKGHTKAKEQQTLPSIKIGVLVGTTVNHIELTSTGDNSQIFVGIVWTFRIRYELSTTISNCRTEVKMFLNKRYREYHSFIMENFQRPSN